MREKLVIVTIVMDGHLPPNASANVRKYIAALNGETITVTVEKTKKKRSNKQSRFYHGVVVPAVCEFFRDSGEIVSPEYAHKYLKVVVGGMGKTVKNPDGSVGIDVETSTKLTTAQWEDWMTAIRAHFAPFGLNLPLPNEADY
jgi:hypothetical protein